MTVSANLLAIVPAAFLYALIILAVRFDLKSRRIPNWLVASGALLGIFLHAVVPGGEGFFSPNHGGLGAMAAVQGWALGLILLMPMYALRTLGAGDVKLIAAIGAFFGPVPILAITVLSMVCGGVLAIVVSLWNRNLLHVLANVRFMMVNAVMRGVAGDFGGIDKPANSTGKLPYAVAIAAGTMLYIVLLKFSLKVFS